jgi:hypothetical protein
LRKEAKPRFTNSLDSLYFRLPALALDVYYSRSSARTRGSASDL